MTPATKTNSNNLPQISPQAATSLVVLGLGGIAAFGIWKLFNSDGRFGQGGVSYENEEKLKTEIARLATEIDQSKLPKDNIYYKNIAASLYNIMNDQMFAIDFGVFTKYSQFPKVVNLLQGLNAEEQKQVVVEFGTRPRSFLFEFGAAGSVFDWFERMFSISQIDQLAQLFAASKLWRTPGSLKKIVELFQNEKNQVNALYWSPWLNHRATFPYINKPGYAIGGNNANVLLYDTSKRAIDSFVPKSYISPTLLVTGGVHTEGPLGAEYIVGYINDDVISKNGVRLKGEAVILDPRYFNQTPPPSELITKYKLT